MLAPGAAAALPQDASPEVRPGEEGTRLDVYLHPGRIFVSPRPAAVTTILGSCVAVCLWDPHRQCGGINHFLLPIRAGNGESSSRYGNVAIRMLLQQMARLGANTRRIRAKLFGGACVTMAARADGSHLGSQNVRLAETFLDQEGIDIVGGSVGGNRGRKIIFCTDDGSSWVKLL